MTAAWRSAGAASLARGDATRLPFGDGTVDLIVTSPPYFALRSYTDGGEHYDGQIGSEATPTAFVEALWAVTAECWRVLKPGGSLWVNLGDKYAGSGGHNNSNLPGNTSRATATPTAGAQRRQAPDRYNQASDGIRAKSLMGLPWRYALGCIDGMADPEGRGWILRSEVIWSKPNGLPESVKDRVRRSHEQWFHLVKEGSYYSSVDAVREPYAPASLASYASGGLAVSLGAEHPSKPDKLRQGDPEAWTGNPLGKLPGSVWTIPTEPLIAPESLGVDHFAAFPTEWPRRIILGWSPSGICTACGEGRRPEVERSNEVLRSGDAAGRAHLNGESIHGADRRAGTHVRSTNLITGESCACPDATAPTRPAVVLDPFGGTGTTAMVAKALGRHGVSLELSADYLRLARWRVDSGSAAAKVRGRTNADAQGALL